MRGMGQYFSQVFIAIAVCFATFYYGGNTQLYLTVVISCLVLGVLVTLWQGMQTNHIVWSKVHSALLLYMGLLVLNLFTSVYPENSRITAWAFFSLPMVVFMVGSLDKDRWLPLLLYLSPAILVSMCWGISEFFISGGRASGPGSDPNSWASTMNLAFFVVLSSYWFAPKRYLVPLTLLLLGLATAIFMSYSRVGLVIFVAALVFVCGLALLMREQRIKAVVLILACASSYVSVQNFRGLEGATNNTEGYTLNAEAYGWTLRFAQWDSALRQYSDHPLTGSGFGTFKVLYPQYRTLADATTAGNYVHNDFIQLLAEGGPALLLCVVALLLFLLTQGFYSLRRLLFTKELETRQRDFELVILITAFGTVFVHGLMNFTFYILVNQLILGVVLGRILALLGLLKVAPFEATRKTLPKAGAVLLAAYVLVISYADAVSFDLVYRGGVIPLDRNDPADQFKVFEILSTIRIFRGDTSSNRFAMATFYRTSFDDQPLVNVEGRRSLAIAAALEYQAGLAINPYANDVRGFFANFLQQSPWLLELPELNQDPEALLREGLALTPMRIQAHVQLANFLEASGRADEAYEVLQNALQFTPLRYDNYRYWRDELRTKLLDRARSRKDHAVLMDLLSTF